MFYLSIRIVSQALISGLNSMLACGRHKLCVELKKYNSQCYIKERQWEKRHRDETKWRKKREEEELFKFSVPWNTLDISFSLPSSEVLGRTVAQGELRLTVTRQGVCRMSCCLAHAVSFHKETPYLHFLQKDKVVKVSSCYSTLYLIQDVMVLSQISRYWESF